MKKTKAQLAADKAFIEKLKTINIGALKNDSNALQEFVESVPDQQCPDCGEPMKCVGAAIVEVTRVPKRKKKQEEQSFAE